MADAPQRTSLDQPFKASGRRTDEQEEPKLDEEDETSGEESGADDGSRKRKRTGRPISVSCELCKQRKVKCDRGQPSCGWCVRNGHRCEYKERKKPGLRAGYGRELESRLDRLEGVLETQQHLIQQLASAIPSAPPLNTLPPIVSKHAASTASPASMTSPSRSDAYHSVRSQATHHSNLVGQVSSSLGTYRTSNVMHPAAQDTHQQLPQLPPLDRMGGLSTGSAVLGSRDHSSPSVKDMIGNVIGSTPANATPEDVDLPPYDLLYALVELFFVHVNTWAPILHRRRTLDTLFGSGGLDEPERILLRAIVATTLKYSSDTRLDGPSRERYYRTSKQKVLLYGIDNSSVRSLQALVILALDVVGLSNGPPGWNLLALITRSVVQLGLAVESNSVTVSPLYPSIYTLRAMNLPEPTDFIEDESRRRLFWMVYILDRYATIATAFEFALDDKEIDRRLPCRDELLDRNQPCETRWFSSSSPPDRADPKVHNLGAFGFYIEVIAILSRVHRFLKKPVDISALSDVESWQREYRELDSCLNRWKFNLPPEFGDMSRIFARGAQKVVIRLHSSAAYPTTRSSIFTPSYSASQRCHNAVEDIYALNSYVRTNSMLGTFGPLYAFSLWVAARLLLVHGSTIDRAVNPSIHELVDTLRQLGQTHKVAERYAALLTRVLDEYHESETLAQSDGGGGQRVTPSTVKILADMRRTAFDLDFLISRQPKQHFQRTRASMSLMNSANVTPARTPARTPVPNDLEYLDVFDFFNMPRLPAGAADPAGAAAYAAADVVHHGVGANGGAEQPPLVAPVPAGDLNITNFMYDAESDWFMRSA